MGTNELPLREQVRSQILEYISRMDLSSNPRLLSEAQLAAKFHVSRSTIRAALNDLETEGKVLRKQGSGTYVNTRTIDINTTLYPRVDMRDMITNNGYRARSKVLSVQSVQAGGLASRLHCSPSLSLQVVKSLYYADDTPCMYCIDTLRYGHIAEHHWKSPTLETQSIYEFLRKTANIHVKWDVIRIQAVTSGEVPELMEYFPVPSGKVRPFVLLEITNYDDGNTPVLYGCIYVDTERIRLNIVRDIGQLS